MYSQGKIVLIGTWLYDNSVECDIAIQKVPVFYGSGDSEDPPEIKDDRQQETFYIWYGSTTHKGIFSAGGGYAFTLEDAKSKAEKALGQKIRWRHVNNSHEENC